MPTRIKHPRDSLPFLGRGVSAAVSDRSRFRHFERRALRQTPIFALRSRNRDVAYVELESNYGHDSFLVDVVEQTDLVRGFLASTFEKVQ